MAIHVGFSFFCDAKHCVAFDDGYMIEVSSTSNVPVAALPDGWTEGCGVVHCPAHSRAHVE